MTVILPHSMDAEQELLGAILVNNQAFARACESLVAEDFFFDAHQIIFAAIKTVIERGDLANPIVLKAYFENERSLEQAGGTSYLARLAAAATTVINAPDYAKVVKDCSARRQLIKAGENLIATAANPDVEDPAEMIAGRALTTLQAIGTSQGGSTRSGRVVATSVAEGLGRPSLCFSTGIPAWDNAMGGGMYAGRTYGVAARKKVGKTILLGTVSQNLNWAGVPHLYWAGEMSPEELEQRAIARFQKFNSIAFLKSDSIELSPRVTNYLRSMPDNVQYYHAPGGTLDDLKRQVAKAIIRHKIKGVVVDYWQLIGGKPARESEEFHLRIVAQWLADFCRQEGLFCLIAAQVNQSGNTRGGEGLKLACDQYYTLHREKHENGGWLEMEESRYTMYKNVGTDINPGIQLNNHGPFFEDIWTPTQEEF